MANLTAATEARLAKSLAQLYRFDGVVMSLGAYLDSKEFEVVEREEGKIQYNRHKFNAMGYAEQAAYEKKLAEKVTRYYAEFADGTLLTIPKLVADHYKEQA
jgi:hypothetical protein